MASRTSTQPGYMGLSDRFWAKVDKSGDCWVWTAARITQRGGYGVFGVTRSVARRAHRVAWELVNGPIPAGMMVCHRCDNPPCVRPDHLFLGTAADNMRDAADKGRCAHGNLPKGERHHSARLTAAAVAEIRRRWRSGERQVALATEYGITQSSVSAAVLGKTWRLVGVGE